MNRVLLSNQVEMPLIGYRPTSVFNDGQNEREVSVALDEGYRLIYTDGSPRNEDAVGRAINKGNIPRYKIFVTGTFAPKGKDGFLKKVDFRNTMERMALGYLDLCLLGQPNSDFMRSWHFMESIYKEGQVRSIGLIDFPEANISKILSECSIPPAVVQAEIHPYHHQNQLIDFLGHNGIKPLSGLPFSVGEERVFKSDLLSFIANAYGKTVAQIILRWHIQRGVIVATGCRNCGQMAENLNIFDFELKNMDMDAITMLDTSRSLSF